VAAAFLAAVAALAVRTARGWTGKDFAIYGNAGRTLLSGSWLHAYHDPKAQAGPFQLALTAILRELFGTRGTTLALVSDLLVAALIVLAVRSLAGRGSAVGLALLAVVALAVGVTVHPYTTGHFGEPIIAVIWLVAAREARRGRVLLAGVLVAAAGGFELWGILGVSVLALAPTWRGAAKGAALAAALFVAQFVPFVVGGDFNLFGYRWYVTGGALSLFFHGMTFGWPLRVLQAAVVLGITIPLARRMRGLAASVFVLPAATAMIRLGIDPMGTFYYWDAPLVIELVGLAAAVSHLDEIRTWAAGRLGRLAPSLEGPSLDGPSV